MPELFCVKLCYIWRSFCQPSNVRNYLILIHSLVFTAVHAQVDSSLYADEPLFSHQFSHINEDRYQFIDTTFNSLKWYYRLNNAFADDFGSPVLTNLGSARNNLLLPSLNDFWNYQGLGPFSQYFTDKGDVPYYHVRSPLTEAKYVSGYNRGQTFAIYHTQNVHKRWNFHIRYKRLNSLGFYTNSQNRQSNFLANTDYVTQNGRYRVKGYFVSEQLETQEFGGIQDDSLFLANFQDSPELIQVSLNSDTRTLRNREFFVQQEAKLASFSRSDSLVDSLRTNQLESAFFSLGHEFKYTRVSQVYDGGSTNFYENYFFSQSGRRTDSTAYHGYENYLYLKTQIGRTNRFDLTAGLKSLTFKYLNEEFSFVNNTLGFSGRISGKLANLMQVSGSVDYAITGNLANTFAIEGNGRISITDWLQAKGGYKYTLRYPELYEQFYIANNYIWQNDFDPYSLGILSYGVSWANDGALTIRNFNATKYVVFGADGIPLAAPTSIKYTQFDLKQNFTFFNWLHFDNRMVYQTSTSGKEYLPLPKWITRNAIYANFRIFQRKLKCMAGAELQYFTRFNSRAYNPALGRFQLADADDRSVGDYPVLNVFAQFKVMKAMIFLKYEHVNQGVNGYDYFVAPNYPMNNRVLRVGINWRFFN